MEAALRVAGSLACYAGLVAPMRLVRGLPRPLIVDGRVSYTALEEEGLTYDDLLAGLRKVGESDPARIRLATLKETGQVSVVART
jgi:uncharacterized membrane protein YcaP (DUF421 family)